MTVLNSNTCWNCYYLNIAGHIGSGRRSITPEYSIHPSGCWWQWWQQKNSTWSTALDKENTKLAILSAMLDPSHAVQILLRKKKSTAWPDLSPAMDDERWGQVMLRIVAIILAHHGAERTKLIAPLEDDMHNFSYPYHRNCKQPVGAVRSDSASYIDSVFFENFELLNLFSWAIVCFCFVDIEIRRNEMWDQQVGPIIKSCSFVLQIEIVQIVVVS